MPQSPFRVLVAGAGVAGLGTLMALRALAGDRVELTLIAPDDEFVFRPLRAQEPFTVGRARRIPLDRAAQDAGAVFVATTIDAVDPRGREVSLSGGGSRPYDALVLAVGAEPMPAVDHVLTWDDRSDAEMLGRLLEDVERGYSRDVAVLIPPGPGWPLRGYELALYIALDARAMGAEIRTTLVTPEPPPLALLGPRAVELVSRELARAGIAVVSAERAEVVRGARTTLVLHPSGERLEVERVLALPILRGRHVPGIPAEADGFVQTDEHCRVRGVEAVWAVGDCTALAVKSGGLAAEQGDVAAADIAALAGADVQATPFEPDSGDGVSGLPAGRHLTSWLVGEDEGLTTQLPPSGVPVLTYLQRDLAAGWRGYG